MHYALGNDAKMEGTNSTNGKVDQMARGEVEVCKDINDVRRNIDLIDRKLVSLIAERGAYVKQAAQFKKNTADVEAPKRVEQVIQKVTDLAQSKGANVKVVQSVWKAMINEFIEAEKEEWAKKVL